MIFNDKYNKIVELMCEVAGEDFTSIYNKIEASLPKEIIDECKKNEEFVIKMPKNGITARYIQTIDKNVERSDLMVDYEPDGKPIGFFILSLTLKNPTDLKQLKITDEKYNEEEFNDLNQLGVLFLCPESKNIKVDTVYSFNIIRKKESEYDILFTKGENDMITCKRTKLLDKKVKTYTYNELINKLNVNINKR